MKMVSWKNMWEAFMGNLNSGNRNTTIKRIGFQALATSSNVNIST